MSLPQVRRKREEWRVTLAGLIANILLLVGKVAVGILTNSAAIVADGLHTGSDLASDVAVVWSLRLGRRPADHDHHFGHSRYDHIFAAIIGFLLFFAALWVAISSALTFKDKHPPLQSWIPFWTAIASIILKEALYWWTKEVGRRYRNPVLLANAWHHRSDAFSSLAVAAGITGALVGGARWAFLDHLTAIILAAFLIFIGGRIVYQSILELTDRAPDQQTVAAMRKLIGELPGVEGFHAFRARRTGGAIEMDVHIQVAPELTVQAGHEIATRLEKSICAAFPEISAVVVHVEPAASRPESTP